MRLESCLLRLKPSDVTLARLFGALGFEGSGLRLFTAMRIGLGEMVGTEAAVAAGTVLKDSFNTTDPAREEDIFKLTRA